MRRLLLVLTALLTISAAQAVPSTIKKSLNVRVGGSVSIGTFGQHTKTCESTGGATVQATKSPSLGEIHTTELQPYVSTMSISGTCLGSHLQGTKVEYFAKSAGNDQFEFDLVFRNGTIHYFVSTTNR